MSEFYYEHYGEPPVGFSILRVEHSYLNLRVYFSLGAMNNAALINPDYYKINVSSPTTAFDFGAISVTPEPDVTYPSYVDVEMGDCTGGATYEIDIEKNVIESKDSTPSNPDYLIGGNTMEFIGVTEDPEVLSVIPLSTTQVKVIFSKYMAQDDALFNQASYVWTNDVRTLKVEKDTNSSVILTVTEMTPSQIYDLTVG